MQAIIKPGSHMPPMYLRRNRRYRLGHFSDRLNENMRRRQLEPSQSFTADMPAKLNLSQPRWHAGGKDSDEQCCRPLLFSEQYPRQYRRPCRRCIGGI